MKVYIFNKNHMLKELWRRTIWTWKFLKLEKLSLHWWETYEVCSRINWKNAVAWIVRHIENQTFILIDQYRYPLKSRVLELVAWVMDKNDKTEIEIMRDEVVEETWYKNIKSINFLATTSASAWMSSETTTLYDIEVYWEKWLQSLWVLEDINVHEVPYWDFQSFLTSKINEWLIIDPKVCMAIFMTLSKTWNI